MKKKLMLILAPLTFLLSCDKDTLNGVPPCVISWIEEVQKVPAWNTPARVYEYSYNGKTVYLTTADCCDQYDTLIDDQCNYICSPSGGITGKGDGKCPDFEENATLKRLVWEDNR